MDHAARLDIRHAYAKRLMAAAGIQLERIERAFASVPREHYLGPALWPILRWSG
jgi:protein-L-isoaspartate(D-aspartate) O-methyltransferase